MRHLRHPVRIAMLALFATAAVLSVVKVSSATGVVNKADLQGNWQIVLGGFTGCGQSTEIANVTLNSSGSGTGTVKTHGNCGDSTETGQTFTINSLSTNGSGTAGLSCGPSCGWAFTIQVSPDRTTMNLVDLTDPGNYLSGIAIHQ
jgi:hypothetical protein